MHQAQRDPGISRVKKRPLAFDHVPVLGGVVGRQGLRRASDEIGDHSVHGDTSTSDHDAGLAGRPEGGWHATGREGAGQGQRRVLFAQRAAARRRTRLPRGQDHDDWRRRGRGHERAGCAATGALSELRSIEICLSTVFCLRQR